ncbi:hypothetical protein IRJ41_021863, partial [Triplophysa rosa]
FHTLHVFSLCLWLAGVFGDEVKSVSVMEGRSVTLHTDLTELQTAHDEIDWRFGVDGPRIARMINSNPRCDYHETFRDRLEINTQTGDLTIKNIRSDDRGVYQLIIGIRNKKRFKVTVNAPTAVSISESTQTPSSSSSSSSPSSSTESSGVSGVFGVKVEVKSVSVMEGENVTLHTNVTELQTDHVIKWRFENIIIATINSSRNINPLYYINDETEMFRDRLKMNNQTGDLTITHITSHHSGLYKLRINMTDEPKVKKNITVTVNVSVESSIVIRALHVCYICSSDGIMTQNTQLKSPKNGYEQHIAVNISESTQTSTSSSSSSSSKSSGVSVNHMLTFTTSYKLQTPNTTNCECDIYFI